MSKKNTYYGEFGGQYVSESLMNTLEELDDAFEEAIKNPEFIAQYNYYLKQYVGRETPLYYAERLSKKYGTKINVPINKNITNNFETIDLLVMRYSI